MCTAHNVLHLGLFFGQLACFQYYKDFSCPFERDFESSTFLMVHAWCFITSALACLLEKYALYELARFFEISKVPVYYCFIYVAHYFELNAISKDQAVCADGKVNLLLEWYIIELRVFYGYILAGILFLMISHLFEIQEREDKKKGDSFLTGIDNADFIEEHVNSLTDFCLHTFEIVSTSIMFIEYYLQRDHTLFPDRNGSYLTSIVLLLVYGIVTAGQSFRIFKILRKDQEWMKPKIWLSLHLMRFGLMVASTVLLFTQKGKEVLFGFWVLTNAVFFICDTAYWSGMTAYKYLRFHTTKQPVEIEKQGTNLTSLQEKDGTTA